MGDSMLPTFVAHDHQETYQIHQHCFNSLDLTTLYRRKRIQLATTWGCPPCPLLRSYPAAREQSRRAWLRCWVNSIAPIKIKRLAPSVHD